jgi:glutathione S-transferase
VRVFLAEKGVDIPKVTIDLGKMEQKSESYAAVNPRQRTPALELDDGSVLCESVAICRYIEALHPEPNLFGRTAKEIGEIEMWGRRMELNLLATIASAFRHLHPAMAAMEVPQVKEWGEVNRGRIVDELAFLDRHLKGRDFVCCDRFTNADITAMIGVDFLRPTRVAVPDDLVDLKRWHAAMQARPSAAA